MSGRKVRVHLQSLMDLLHRLDLTAGKEQPAGQRIVDGERKRVELPGTFRLCNPLLKPPEVHQISCIPVVTLRIPWIKLQGAFVFSLGSWPIPFESFRNECERSMSLGE